MTSPAPRRSLAAAILTAACFPLAASADVRRSMHGLLPERTFPSARDYFEPLLADPAELGYGGRYVLEVGGDRFGEVTIGDYVGLFRWKPGARFGAQLNLGGGANARFNLSTERNNMEVVDFTAALPLDMHAEGGHAVRAGIWHTSSHLGDDLIRRLQPPIQKRSMDLARILYSYSPCSDGSLRFYGGGSVAFNAVNLGGRGALQAGGEWMGPRLFRLERAQGFLAQDLQFLERTGWNPAYSIRGGVRFTSQERIASAKAFLEYFTGRLYYLQFRETRESRWSLGINFEIGNPTRP